MLLVSSGTKMEPQSDLKAKERLKRQRSENFWYSVFKFHHADLPVFVLAVQAQGRDCRVPR